MPNLQLRQGEKKNLRVQHVTYVCPRPKIAQKVIIYPFISLQNPSFVPAVCIGTAKQRQVEEPDPETTKFNLQQLCLFKTSKKVYLKYVNLATRLEARVFCGLSFLFSRGGYTFSSGELFGGRTVKASSGLDNQIGFRSDIPARYDSAGEFQIL